jgi:predicted DNA binding CopG/RHH family protein
MTAGRRWTDPFDDMSDEDFDAHVEALFSARPRTAGVSLRIPQDLLERVKREAIRAEMPYQTFIKAMLEAAVSRLERRGRTAPRVRGSGARDARRPRATRSR